MCFTTASSSRSSSSGRSESSTVARQARRQASLARQAARQAVIKAGERLIVDDYPRAPQGFAGRVWTVASVAAGATGRVLRRIDSVCESLLPECLSPKKKRLARQTSARRIAIPPYEAHKHDGPELVRPAQEEDGPESASPIEEEDDTELASVGPSESISGHTSDTVDMEVESSCDSFTEDNLEAHDELVAIGRDEDDSDGSSASSSMETSAPAELIDDPVVPTEIVVEENVDFCDIPDEETGGYRGIRRESKRGKKRRILRWISTIEGPFYLVDERSDIFGPIEECQTAATRVHVQYTRMDDRMMPGRWDDNVGSSGSATPGRVRFHPYARPETSRGAIGRTGSLAESTEEVEVARHEEYKRAWRNIENVDGFLTFKTIPWPVFIKPISPGDIDYPRIHQFLRYAMLRHNCDFMADWPFQLKEAAHMELRHRWGEKRFEDLILSRIDPRDTFLRLILGCVGRTVRDALYCLTSSEQRIF